VVLENTIVPAYSLVVGSPGKVKKTYENKEEITQVLKASSDLYAKKAKTFADKSQFYEI
jgi:carbonic anhydrase/acetyltransferase-like protein (isoleucine patch superfamily)